MMCDTTGQLGRA